MKKLVAIIAALACFAALAPAQKVRTVTVIPTSVEGGISATGTVTLSAKAGSNGLAVSLSSSSTAASVPDSVMVAGGARSATFKVMTTPVSVTTRANLVASAGSGSAMAALTIHPPKLTSLTFNPDSVLGGASTTGKVQIGSPAPSGGVTVGLACTSRAWAGPLSVIVSAGSTSATFTCGTKAVTVSTVASVTAKLSTSVTSARLTIKPPTLSGLTLNPSEVGGGATSTGTVTLTGPAPLAGIKVLLKSTKAWAKVPATVTVSGGSSSTTFVITTSAVTMQQMSKITATHGATSVSQTLTIDIIGVSSVSLNPSTVTGGASSTGKVNLNGPAPAIGLNITLTSSKTAAIVFGSVSIGSGQTSATFSVSTIPVGQQIQSTITATLLARSASAVLTINPPALSGLSLTPSTIVGGSNSTGTVTISSAAPVGGIAINLTSNGPAATVPNSVTIAAGATSTTFNVQTLPVVSSSSVTVTAMMNGVSIGVPITLQPPAISGLTLNPSILTAGTNSMGTVSISSAAPAGGFTISLSSNQTSVTVPASVVIAAGTSTATFTINTSAVLSQTIATITGTDPNGKVASAQLTVGPQTVLTVPIDVNDMNFDAVSGNIWVAAQITDPNYSNCIVAVNPKNGSIGTVINMGVQLGHIRVTDNGQFAYVDCPQDGSVRRANLVTGTVDAVFPINQGGIFDLETIPGLPHWFALVTDPVYGANTHVWIDGDEHVGIGTGGYDIRFLNSTQWYGDGHGQVFFDTIETTGIDWTDTVPFDCSGFILSKGLMYTAVPNIVDPAQKIVIESLPTTDFFSGREVDVSTSDNRIYYITWDPSHNKRILGFDLKTYAEQPFFDIGSIPGNSNGFMACGNHTVAFFISGDNITQNLVIVRGLQ